MPRSVVSGGAGFIGSNLVDRLVDDGHEVFVIDDLSSGSLANLTGARRRGSDRDQRAQPLVPSLQAGVRGRALGHAGC